MGRKPRLTKKRVKEAIKDSFGIKLTIAKRCDVTRQSLHTYLYKKGNENLLKMIQDEGEKILDIGETKLMKFIAENNFKAVKFLLERKGKNRGYAPKQEIETKDVSEYTLADAYREAHEQSRSSKGNNKKKRREVPGQA